MPKNHSDPLLAVNHGLLWPKPKAKSGLSSYFKGHNEFQEPYREPSLSPDPPAKNAKTSSAASKSSLRAGSVPPNMSATGRRGGGASNDPAKRSYPSQDNSLSKKPKRGGMCYILETWG
jgi:hypothetical protein